MVVSELNRLEEVANKSGKGMKSATDGVNSLGDSSAKAGSSVKGASDAIDNLGDSGAKAGKGLKGAEGSVDSLSDSSVNASSNVKGTSNSLDGLADSGAKAGKDLKGADGAIGGLADSSSQASSSVKGISDGFDSMSSKANEAASSTSNVKNATEQVGQETSRATISIKDLAVSLGLVAVASKAFGILKSSLDSAISRFDTLNTFPAVLQALGVSAEDSKKAMSKLSEGIDGLPTTLNDIAGNAQRMYTAFSDMDKAADTAIALNNALLGSGSSAADAERGMQMYQKVLATGKVDMVQWTTLSETMDVGLIKIAESFGFAGKTAKSDLYEALKYGAITMDEFNDKLIELGTGTGIMAQLAKENSLGLATSIGNLKNAASRGVANIIESFNNLTKEVTGKEISQNIDSMKVVVNVAFKTIGSVIEGTAPIVKGFASTIQATLPVVNALSPALIGLASAYAIHSVIQAVTSAITANTAIMKIGLAVKTAYTIATNNLDRALTLTLVRTKLAGAALLAYNKIVAIAVTVQAMLTTGMTLASVGAIALSGAISILGTAIKILMGPVGWVTLAIGALVGAVIGIVKWFNRASEEGKRMSKETEELSSSVDSLNSSVEESSKAYKDNQTEINASAKANEQLAQKVEELAAKENKSAGEKALLQSHIESLNGSIEGLNLAYNEETNALNMSSEKLKARIDLMKEQESGIASQERLTEIMQEQIEAQMKLDEINALQQEWNDKKSEGTVKAREANEALGELQEQEDALNESLARLSEQQIETEQQIITSAENIATAIEEGNLRQVISYEELSEEQKDVFDEMKSTYDSLVDNATNAFDKMSGKSKATAKEMIENLEHNQKMTKEWGENIAKLHEWAGENSHAGFMNWLETLGPDSAAELAVISKMTPTELEKFASLMDEGGKVASESLKTSLGEGMEEVADAMTSLIDTTANTTRERILAADFESIGLSVPQGMEKGMNEGAPKVEKSAIDMANDVIDKTKKTLGTNSPSKEFEYIGDSIPQGMELGISNGIPAVVNTAKKLAVETLKLFDNTPKEFEVIGKDAMAGFNRGLVAGEAQVMATARSIANSVASEMRRALDTHSPSRVTEKIGKDTTAGFSKGMTKKQKEAEKAAKKVAQAATKRFKEAFDSASYKFKMSEIDATEYVKSLEKVKKEYAKTPEQIRKVNLEIKRIQDKHADELAKSSFEASKQWIDRQKKYNEMSLTEELSAWERVQERYKAGTKQREDAEENVYRVKKEIHDKLISLNDEYLSKMKQEIEEYERTVEQRTQSIRNTFGLFDEINQKDLVAGDSLIDNLRGQVNEIKDWSDNLRILAERGIDKGLLAELQDMGPRASSEIYAMVQMADDQLTEFEELWTLKTKLAKEQALIELEDLRVKSENKLKTLKDEWQSKMEDVRYGTKNQLGKMPDDLNTIGNQAIAGMINGMESMRGPLIDKARSLASEVRNAMQSELDINSPSRVMKRDVGRWIPEGIALGIKENAKSVYDALHRLSDGIMIASSPEMALGIPRIANNAKSIKALGNGLSYSNQNSYDQSRKMYNTIEVKGSNDDAREIEKVLKRLEYGF